ncbi:uncharacterized protein AC631_03301 [Debaryomyces fabryi]|uniref:Iron transporter FTH1 n=1 Tax=Debaryomyces fabryi TaxID=58627 RepID=A0A0V1PXK0_9ASCO|nr:uncharacterized protein AC631_03301 [Debaryomyces fabryi]KSA00931.1 hypothetical protein AC631_03301 [Debaryomyces fabryi]CUM52405.1 unnamed protein product [Debaryomyces fabryi]
MIELSDYFSIEIFFIILRETLETAIIISVLLSFINQRSHSHDGQKTSPSSSRDSEISERHEKEQKRLKLQVWAGAVIGLLICLVIGLIFITCFYIIGKDYWSYTERLWEGVFSLLSSIIITVMGIGLLRINKVMKVKWWVKLGSAYNTEDNSNSINPDNNEASDGIDSELSGSSVSHERPRKLSFTKKYFLAILPLITTLREGLEAVVFVGGIGMSQPPTSIPLSIVGGILVGSSIGYMLYKGGNKMSLQYFLIFLTCFLYIVSAGLMSRGVWFIELERYVRLCGGLDVSETGSGPGSYDIANSVWHVNCCNGLTDGWWMVLNAIIGWTNSATYGSVISYCVYWLFVALWLEIKLYEEKQGVLPLVPIKWQLKRIRKKVKLYESRLKHHREYHQHNETNTSEYHELESNPSMEINPREAEGQLLLSTD